MYGLNLSVFIMMLGVGMAVAFLPGKVIGLTGVTTSVAYLTAAYAVSNFLVQVPMGILSDRLGYKRFLIAGYLLCGLSGFCFCIAKNEGFLYLGRMVQGVGEAPIWAIASALLSILYPQAKGKAIGLYNASLHVGLTVGPLLGILVLRFFPSSADDIAFTFFTCTCFFSALLVFFLVENPTQPADVPAEKVAPGKILALTKDGTILCVLLGITLYGAGYGITVTSTPAYLLRFRGYGQTYVQVFFIAFYLSVCASQLFTGPLSDRLGREPFMACGLGAAALLFALFPTLGPVGTIAAAMVASFGLGAFCLSSMAYLNGTVPNTMKGTISGAYFLFWGVGYFSGPMLVGHLGELWRGILGFYCYAGLLLAECLALVWFFRASRKKRAV
jgi:Arabinose efflux permease